MMEAISKIVRFSIVFNLCLDETLIYRFKNQISSLVIDITESDEADSIEIIRLIFTHICVMFTNFRYLNFGPSLNRCQQLSFRSLLTSI